MPNTDIHTISPFPLGQDNLDYAQYFTGKSWLAELNLKEVAIHNVTFEAGCRNDWHIHHGTGQILICVGGHGWYQEEGKEAVSLEPGKVIVIPANTKHWHGAKKDSWFSHISVEVPGENTSNTWLEAVSDDDYNAL
ncbi:MAG: cupin domain-containing protein [Streptococcus gallolyticus]|nr:cupin domain-containing protein [Streptococcus gallolyticus]